MPLGPVVSPLKACRCFFLGLLEGMSQSLQGCSWRFVEQVRLPNTLSPHDTRPRLQNTIFPLNFGSYEFEEPFWKFFPPSLLPSLFPLIKGLKIIANRLVQKGLGWLFDEICREILGPLTYRVCTCHKWVAWDFLCWAHALS